MRRVKFGTTARPSRETRRCFGKKRGETDRVMRMYKPSRVKWCQSCDAESRLQSM
jgi:hypothetical protein